MMTEASAGSLKHHRQVTWFVLILLLLLRIPFVISIIYLLPIDDQSGATIYELGTYLLIAFLIWWERNRLADFHIDTSTLVLIILFRPLQTLILGFWEVDTPLAFPRPFGSVLWIISIGLFLSLWHSGFKTSRLTSSTLGWLGIGLFAGVLVSVLDNLKPIQSAFANANTHPLLLTSIFTTSGLNLVYHLGFAPINEEPLFRAFLWGCLLQIKWKEGWILLAQAALFMAAHVYFVNQYPFRFWVFIPFMGLLLGFLAMRSHSISPGILAHGMINGSAYLLLLNFIPILR
jgi:membrane protease YdiL (CAAX protease family)